jgi:hypothetical protein
LRFVKGPVFPSPFKQTLSGEAGTHSFAKAAAIFDSRPVFPAGKSGFVSGSVRRLRGNVKLKPRPSDGDFPGDINNKPAAGRYFHRLFYGDHGLSIA